MISVMSDLLKYRDWLVQARGVESPSQAEVERFRDLVGRHRTYGTLFELFLALWMDRRSDHVGTRGYLRFQGLSKPSQEDLAYFHRRIARAAVWRAATVVVLAVAWSAFACATGIWWSVPNAVILSAILVGSLGVTCGKKLVSRQRCGSEIQTNPGPR